MYCVCKFNSLRKKQSKFLLVLQHLPWRVVVDKWIIPALTDVKLLFLFQDPLGNMLSAEAKVFVPRQQHGSTDVVENGLLSPGATSGSMTDGLLDGEGQYPGQHPVNGLPGYITTCYPFVSGADPRYSMDLNLLYTNAFCLLV